MSDLTLRELERRARASDDPLDEERLIGARLHAGLIDKDRLRLAAYCNHRAALSLMAHECPLCGSSRDGGGHLKGSIPCPWCHSCHSHPLGHNYFDPWVRNFSMFGRVPGVRASLAALKAVIDNWDRGTDPDYAWATNRADLAASIATAEAIEAWLNCPCEPCIHAWSREWRMTGARGSWIPPVWDGIVWIFGAASRVGQDAVRTRIRHDVGNWAVSGLPIPVEQDRFATRRVTGGD